MYKFDHEAMNAKLDLLICGCDYNYARSAAEECFGKVSMLESLLGMYCEGSDIDMINSSPVGGIVKLTGDACDCLMQAFGASAATGGAIDVCLGDYFSRRKASKGGGKIEPVRGRFELDPEDFYIKKVAEGKIDLGCIGKGYAVDEAVKILRDTWEIGSAFMNFGGSSIYAFGMPDGGGPWKVNLAGGAVYDVPESGAGIGASGTSVLGEHIVDARTGEVPQNQPFRTWAFSASAAASDALSTAFMVLGEPEIRRVCSENGVSAAVQRSEDSPVEFL